MPRRNRNARVPAVNADLLADQAAELAAELCPPAAAELRAPAATCPPPIPALSAA
jgi:hypothetical protein